MSRTSLKIIYNSYFQKLIFVVISFLYFLPQQSQAQCNSIYDRIVSGYHSTMAVKTDGKIAVWGENMGFSYVNQLTPWDLSPLGSNTAIMGTIGGGLQGGADQSIFLVSDGLYALGNYGGVLSSQLTSTTNFQKILTPTGGDALTKLPSGMAVNDVASIFATYKTLLIVTKNDGVNSNRNGQVWIITQTSQAVEANGGSDFSAGSSSWKRVYSTASTPLTNIIASRGQVSPIPSSSLFYSAFMALAANGDVYTWGNSTYLGDNSSVAAKLYATKMTLPTEFSSSNVPKMIGVTGGTKNVINPFPAAASYVKNTYYLLSSSGSLYALGDNSKYQCGDFTKTERSNWVKVQKSASAGDYFTDINFISVQEHTAGIPCASAITTDGKLYTWGEDDAGMLGKGTGSIASYDPGVQSYSPGIANGSAGSTALFCEMGGHTLMYLKVGSEKFCYVGHKSRGSMGDGTNNDVYITSFDCTNTPQISICGSVPVAPVTNSSVISASPTTIVANGTSTSTITVQLKNSNGVNLTTTGGVGVITTSLGTISSTVDNNDGTYKAILTSPISSGTATLGFKLSGTTSSSTATVEFTPLFAPLTPGLINGSAITCLATTGLTYSVSPVDNAESYDWTVPNGWTITAGQGTYSITVTAGPSAINGNISVSAINRIGTSGLSTLAVTVRPVFTSGEISSIGETICYGGTPTLIGSTTASSGGNGVITYSWRSSADGYVAVIPSATSATYTPPAGLTSTTSYRRYANDGICNTTATVSIGTWTVTVLPVFVTGTIGSTGETICNGGTPTTTIGNTTASSGGNGSITYSWRSSADGYAAAIPSAIANTYTPPAGLTTTTSYRRYANDGVCNTTPTVSSGTWTVTVRAAFTSGEISSTGETICNGGTPTTTIGNTTASSGGNESITYYWRSSVDGFDVAIPSATSATYMPPAGLTSTTSYRRYANDGLCNLSSTVSVGTWTVTVLPVFVTGTISSTGETICNRGTPITTIGNTTTSSGGNGSITYSWRSSADGFATAIPLATAATYTPPAGLTSSTTYRRYANDGVCNTTATVSSGSWIVTVLPAFTTGTISSTGETICSGGTPTMTIGNTTFSTGGNGSISYSWRSSADGFVTAIPLATAATYTPPAGLTSTTSYRRYANDGLCNTTPTVSAGTWTVTVGTAFSPGEISSNGETICYGGTPTLIGNTTASSGGNGIITYSWRSSADGYTTAIPSATAATYTPPAGLTSTTSYRRCANDGLCNPTATVSIGTWTVTVRARFSSGEISSTGETICNGGTPILSIGNTTASSGGNGSITYSWRSSADGYVAAIPLATAATYIPPAGLTNTTAYRRYANDGLCNTTATVSIGTWTVTVRAAFSSGEINGTGETICNVGNPTITIGSTTASSGGNGSITYSWRSSADGFAAAIPLATAATYIPPAGLTSTTSYRRYANDGLCNTTPTVSSGTWTVTYLPTFSSGEITSAGETICNNGNPILIGSTIASSGGNASITYKWQANGVDITNSNSATYDPPSGLTTTTTYTRYAKDGTCNLTFTLSSGTYTVTVRPNFSAGTISSTGETICYNGNPILIGNTTAATGGDASITYKWQANGVDIGNSNSATYDPPTGLTATTTYTRYAKDGTCNLTYASSSGNWLVVVNALPSPSFIAEPGASACPGIDVTYSTQSNQSNYIWTIPGILNTDYTITSGGTTASNTVTLKWLTTGSKTITINYSNSNNCTAASATSSIATTVKSINTVSNASSTPTICINTAITNITHLTTGATGISGSGITGTNGLPDGVSASWTSNTITISGTPSSIGIFNYSIPLTGGCGVISSTGTIAVTANNTVTRTSAATTDVQTVCINTAMTPITYSTIGATGATFSNLPSGVTGNWANNLITISGIPPVAGSALTYSILLTGGCGVISTTGTITVSANNSATRTSAVATETQTVCINTPISTIAYATSVATGANVSNLPSGVTGSWSNNILTIIGSPTAAGSAKTYTVNLTGGCGVFTTTGTIAVTPNNTVTRTSAASTIAQTVCINSAITSITYSTTGATGASFIGLPPGVTGIWSNNGITISGTPTSSVAAQTYTVTLTGGCGVITTTGTITVLANNTVTRTSAVGTDAQSVCANTAMTPIIYATTVATGATVTNLPSGITSSWSNNLLTISGTPSVVGTALTYTITLTGGCGVVTTTGTIAVKPKNTIALSSLAGTDNQLKCINTAISNITYNTTGATGANFIGLPVGVSGIWSNDAIVLSGSPSISGSFNYAISLIGGCAIADKSGTINVSPENNITLSSTATSDSQSICIGKDISTIEYTTIGATGFTITGLPTGLQAVFQSNKIKISGTPSVTGVFNYTISLVGGCGLVNKNGTVIINSLPIGTIAASNNGIICEGSTVVLSATGGNTYEWILNGNPIPGVSAASYSTSIAGLYSVKLISDKGCINSVQQTVTLSLNNAPVVGYSFDKYCINTPIIFTNSSTTNLSGPVTMLWDFGDNGTSASNSPTHTFLVEKTYSVKLTITPTNCPLIAKSLSKNIKIEVPPLPVRYPPVYALKNTTTKLAARSIGKTYTWSPSTGLSNAFTISPNFNFTAATNYVIKITNDAGCIFNDSLNVLIFDKADFFVPNAFSPNNDGRNDKLLFAAPGIETLQYLRIFNRWGNLVFETSNLSVFWDGTFKGLPQPAEVYSWFAEGISKSGNKIQRNGQILILR